MSSILTNSSALTALQSLETTQKSLAAVQQQVSTGLKVSSAADNASYWSIATQLSANNGVVKAANDSLAQSQAVISTANSALDSVISTIKSIQTTLTQAANPGADFGNINTTLASLGKQLTDAVKGASFNGLNLLDGSVSALNFVAGFTATSSGGTFNTIGLTTQALTGSGGTATTTTAPDVTDSATITNLKALADNSATVTTASYGNSIIDNGTTDANKLSIESVALDGTSSTTTYTGLDASGNETTVALAASFSVSISTTPPAGLLTQGATDLTNITTSASSAAGQLNNVNAALKAVTTYAAVLGATQDRMTSASTLNASLTTSYSNGVSALVDADMNEASTKLQALQTQQQLGIQSLSIANQSSQLILKLFQ